MIVAVAFVRPMQAPFDQVVDVIAVRNRFVPAPVAMRVLWIAVRGVGVAARVRLVDRDHVLIDVAFVGMVEVPVVYVVDVVVVAHRGVAATRSVLVRVGALVDLVSHVPTLRPRGSQRKHPRGTPQVRS